MKTRNYELQGKDVPANLRGAVLTFPVAETSADIAKLCQSEPDAIELAQSAYDVWLQGRVRALAARKPGEGQAAPSVESLNAFISGARYARRTEGTGGGSKPKTPAGIAKQKAASSGNRLFERCAADETFRDRMVKQGIVDLAEFQEWTAARAQVASATPGGSANGSQGKQAATPAKAGK